MGRKLGSYRQMAIFNWRVETDKGIFFGAVEAWGERESESLLRKVLERIGLSVSGLKSLMDLPPGKNNTFVISSVERISIDAGVALWIAVGKKEEFYRKLAKSARS
jgi:hypothetical protein